MEGYQLELGSLWLFGERNMVGWVLAFRAFGLVVVRWVEGFPEYFARFRHLWWGEGAEQPHETCSVSKCGEKGVGGAKLLRQNCMGSNRPHATQNKQKQEEPCKPMGPHWTPLDL